jgi:hypothetical protein
MGLPLVYSLKKRIKTQNKRLRYFSRSCGGKQINVGIFQEKKFQTPFRKDIMRGAAISEGGMGGVMADPPS